MILAVLVLLIMSYFSIFHQLDKQPMQLWDESSYALNAQEMLERKNPFEMYLLGEPELYNTKPPFAIWCMAISIHFIGLNELGARLPAALFALFAVVLLFYISYRYTQNGFYALFPPLILLSSTGFISEHIARTGDTDSILAFWILAQCVAIFLYTTLAEGNQKYLLIAAICFTMGCFTKGIAGFSAIPGIIAWLIYTQKLRSIFTQKEFYVGVTIFIIIVPGYYLFRNYLTPGYLDTVYRFEVGGRLWQQEFLNPEKRPFYYYYQSMIMDERLITWVFILPVSIIVLLRSAKNNLQQLGMLFLFGLISVSVILALSSTKLFWHDAPLYPLIAGVIGISFLLLIKKIESHQLLLLVIGITCWPYYTVVYNNIKNPLSSHFPSFLKNIRTNKYSTDSLVVINADPNFPLHFYAKQQTLSSKYLEIKHPMSESLIPNMLIITEKYAREVDVNKRFILDTLAQQDECRLYRIIALREDNN
jgi:4-amino-4-deoxy-L-arabinose transferase-like glycosyltransferase